MDFDVENIYPECGMLDRKYQKMLQIKQYVERNNNVL